MPLLYQRNTLFLFLVLIFGTYQKYIRMNDDFLGRGITFMKLLLDTSSTGKYVGFLLDFLN